MNKKKRLPRCAGMIAICALAFLGACENSSGSDGTLPPAEVPVAGVSLNTAGLQIPRGGTGALTATVSPADASDPSLEWSSSDPSVVSLGSAGKSVTLHALRAGTSVITVSSIADPAKTTSCTVTVAIQGIEIAFIGFEDETIALNTAVEEDWLVVTAPGGFDRYLWYMDDSYRESTSDPTLDFDLRNFGIGSHTITVIVDEDGRHFSKTLAYTVGY